MSNHKQMRVFFLIVFITLFFSCKFKLSFVETGVYTFPYKNGKEELVLRDDSTFTFTRHISLPAPTCSGKWHIKDQNILVLECVDEKKDMEPFMKLSQEYLQPRIRELKILSKNKLKMELENNTKRKHVVLRKD